MTGKNPALAVVDQPAEESEQTRRQRIIGQQMIVLRDKYRAEFDALCEEAFAAQGLVYRRRLTPQEAARKKIEALAAEAGISVEFAGQVQEPAAE